NGKTTTKEFAHSILASFKSTYASQGSFNNHWGVPFSLLSAQQEDEIVVQEMGMNHKGEIATLCHIAEPDIVLCTMVGRAHIGELGSQQAIAEAKEEIYQCSPKAQFIFNLDNEFTLNMFEKYKNRKSPRNWTFSSFNEQADIKLRAEKINTEGLYLVGRICDCEGSAVVPTFGRQNIVNVMSAAALALSAGMSPQDIWKQLPSLKTTWGRNQWMRHSSGARILFDAYNANPDSMEALIKNIFEWEERSGKVILILGEMKELGGRTEIEHQKLGELAASISPDIVWFVGPSGESFKRGLQSAQFSKNLYLSGSFDRDLAVKISEVLSKEDLVLIKASRAMKLEQVIDSWNPSK
ncbi:MAG: UDP-N-acetylmuramoyl-tripeptide--D-alanyl-D-alanine ligase, partial [Bdellovibrionales bacterium]|nr:UDP-N-acetylmuramoyl-tripeptide--D-alanyl-D-alanine ligase [Bdellovibrionales bacterium]